MRRYRAWLTAAVATVVLVTLPGAPASAAAPEPGGRILYLQFAGSILDPGDLKSIRPSGQGGLDLGVQLQGFAGATYSPDGLQIAYDYGFSFQVMSADGTNDHEIAEAGFGPGPATWSPDGRFVTAEAGGDIMAARSDETSQILVNLTGAHNLNDLEASWAPNGLHFATPTFPGVEIYSADGVHARQLSTLAEAFRLAWSPDGNTIAVEAQGDLWLVTVASGAVRRLTNTPNIQEDNPTWSPNGHWLAYGRGPGMDNPDIAGLTTDPVIWLMDSNGGHRHSTGIHGLPTSWRVAG
jgi:TolB protein